MKIVLTREVGKNDELRALLPPGASVDEVPLTATTYFDVAEVRVALGDARASGMFRTLVLTSERSADYVGLALYVSTPEVEVFAVGPATARALDARDVTVRAHGEGSAESLAELISIGPVLVLGATQTRPELAAQLRAKGLEVAAVACYETMGLTPSREDVEKLRAADVVFVGAPSAWVVGRDAVSERSWVVVPGSTTAAVVRIDHSRVIEGWGPQLTTRLAELATPPKD